MAISRTVVWNNYHVKSGADSQRVVLLASTSLPHPGFTEDTISLTQLENQMENKMEHAMETGFG